MQKKITKVAPGMHGHLHLEFADGSMLVIHRGNHEAHAPAVGDLWPPEAAEASAAHGDDEDDFDGEEEDEGHGEA